MSLDLDADRRVGFQFSVNGQGASRATAHAVRFYDDDEDLLTALADFVGAALAAGDTAIVLATPGHLDGLGEALRTRGLDAESVRDQGRLLSSMPPASSPRSRRMGR